MSAEQPQTTLQTETRPHVCVWALGESTALPDRCSITIQLRSTKSSVAEAKQSVQKRLDYILSALHNHGVSVSIFFVHFLFISCLSIFVQICSLFLQVRNTRTSKVFPRDKVWVGQIYYRQNLRRSQVPMSPLILL